MSFQLLAVMPIIGIFHSPAQGQHTGYITAVEKAGLIWPTWTAYLKTDTQSSQEDRYCVTDPNIVTRLQSAQQSYSRVTVSFSNGYIMPPWQCAGGDESIITGEQAAQ